MKNSTYLKHDEIYKSLKEGGYEGWGGSSFKNRHAGWEENVSRIVQNLGSKRGKLAELGSGTGDRCFLFEKEGFDVTGYEVSKTAVDWANEKSSEHDSSAEFFNINLCEVDAIGDDQFDVVIDGNCAHCIIGDDRSTFFRNIYKSLIDGGIFYISSITHETISGVGFNAEISPVERYFVSREQLINELNGHGFQVEESWVTNRKNNDHFSAILKKVA